MFDITATSDLNKKKELARLRRQAHKRGFRILRDWTGTFSLIDSRIEPQRAVMGLVHVPLNRIAVAIFTPLPERPPRRRKLVSNPAVQPGFNGPVVVETGRAA